MAMLARNSESRKVPWSGGRSTALSNVTPTMAIEASMNRQGRTSRPNNVADGTN